MQSTPNEVQIELMENQLKNLKDGIKKLKRQQKEEEEVHEIIRLLEQNDDDEDIEMEKCHCGADVHHQQLKDHVASREHRTNFLLQPQFAGKVSIYNDAFRFSVMKYKLQPNSENEIDIGSFLESQREVI